MSGEDGDDVRLARTNDSPELSGQGRPHAANREIGGAEERLQLLDEGESGIRPFVPHTDHMHDVDHQRAVLRAPPSDT
jgi:hypothetical protein